MASERTPIESQETPLKTGEEVKDLGTETTEKTPETALGTAPVTTSADGTPAKPSAKEKITGILHQTQDKIKGSVAGVKEKISSKK